MTAFEFWHGPGLTFNGKGYPACSVTALSHGGPVACPPTSFQRTRWKAVGLDRSLQVVAGIPITWHGFTFARGGKSYAKKYIATTRCPAGGWAWKVRVRTRDATGAAAVHEAHGRTPCHR